MASAATVSPPPATLSNLPAWVNSAAFFASATVARSKGGVSKAPTGPFHTKVRLASKPAAICATLWGPISRIIAVGGTALIPTVRVTAPASSFSAVTASTGKMTSQPRAFALVEAQIFEQRDLARLEGGNNPLRLGADAVRREIYRPPDRPAQRLDERAQRQFRVRPLGPAEMR